MTEGKHTSGLRRGTRKVIIDLDETICSLPEEAGRDYQKATPRMAVVERLRKIKSEGFEIVIHTARNMRTFEGKLGLINVHTLPVILGWLNANDIPFDEVIVGKPWPGDEGFYVDDRAIRPSEFVELSTVQILRLLRGEKER